MHLNMLEWLRCSFCGSRLEIVDASPIARTGDDVASGVLGCECCAYPIVAGIPVLIADDTTRAAMHQLEDGRGDAALLTLLGLDTDRAAAFTALLANPGAMTYRSALEVLSPDPEGTYFLYRFSDPTFVMAESVLQAVGQEASLRSGMAIDLCGGSGHLTRVLASQREGVVVLADVFFWKLWLAKHFTATSCVPVCCDANNPLPFSRETFQLVVLSDAFPYIWHKRMLADEMMRLVGPTGAIVMPHLHSSLGENFSPGMTLTPASYRDLFEPMEPQLFQDSTLLDDILDRGVVELGRPVSAEALGTTPSLTLVASKQRSLFRTFALAAHGDPVGELIVNPLYRVEVGGGASVLTLDFPNDEYEEEFGACKRYLPASLTMAGEIRGSLMPGALGPEGQQLRLTRVLIDAPPRYC